MPRFSVGVVAVSLVLLAGGCGGSRPTGESSLPATSTVTANAVSAGSAPAETHWDPKTGPCGLVTEADATAFLGTDPGPALNNPQAASIQCSYGTDGVLLQITSAPNAKALFEQSKAKDFTDGSATPVDGLGDAAVTSPIGATSTAIYFVKGTYSVIMFVKTGGDASAVPAAIRLAKTIAARIVVP